MTGDATILFDDRMCKTGMECDIASDGALTAVDGAEVSVKGTEVAGKLLKTNDDCKHLNDVTCTSFAPGKTDLRRGVIRKLTVGTAGRLCCREGKAARLWEHSSLRQ